MMLKFSDPASTVPPHSVRYSINSASKFGSPDWCSSVRGAASLLVDVLYCGVEVPRSARRAAQPQHAAFCCWWVSWAAPPQRAALAPHTAGVTGRLELFHSSAVLAFPFRGAGQRLRGAGTAFGGQGVMLAATVRVLGIYGKTGMDFL